jgi:hypothetical protein
LKVQAIETCTLTESSFKVFGTKKDDKKTIKSFEFQAQNENGKEKKKKKVESNQFCFKCRKNWVGK